MNSKKLYFIAILPPEDIQEEIRKIKLEIKEEFGIQHALKLPAHFTLQIPFRRHENEEDLLLRNLQEFSEVHRSFQARLKDFDHFSNRVIFIPVEEPLPFKRLHKALQKMLLKIHDFAENEIVLKIHPHITLATRDLNRRDFPKVWDHFRDRIYSAQFEAKDLVLFKHNGKTWDICRKFSLAKA